MWVVWSLWKHRFAISPSTANSISSVTVITNAIVAVNITAAINENIVQHMLQGDGNGPLLEDGTGIRVESPCKLLPTIRGVFEDVSSMSSVLSTKSVIVESTDGECC